MNPKHSIGVGSARKQSTSSRFADNSFNDGTPTPFNFWRNDDLEAWVSTPANNGGTGTTDKGSSSGTDATSAGGTSDRSLKFDSSGERAYQPFEIEIGVTHENLLES